MFAAPWIDLALFAAGQAAAWWYLHTGRRWIGAVATVALWVLADWLLVAKFVFSVPGPDLVLPRVLLLSVGLSTALSLLFAVWRRRWSRAARARKERFAAGIAAYLRADLAGAQGILRGLVRTDPWDAAAWTALGNVMLRAGRPARARRCYRRALGVDTRGELGEFVRHQLELARRADEGGPSGAPVDAAAAIAPAPTH